MRGSPLPPHPLPPGGRGPAAGAGAGLDLGVALERMPAVVLSGPCPGAGLDLGLPPLGLPAGVLSGRLHRRWGRRLWAQRGPLRRRSQVTWCLLRLGPSLLPLPPLRRPLPDPWRLPVRR